jgi:5-dehydro-4-deoxyglucarate dehydratase
VSIGVILYNRDNAVLGPQALASLADACPNLIGLKDGHGDIELLVRIRHRIGDRLVYVGGMPTAETYALPYKAAGIDTYSSAIFNFVPEAAMRFYRAVEHGDADVTSRMLHDFFLPYLDIRNRENGYAVSIVKAGMRVVGRDAGPVRPPLTDLSGEEQAMLGALIEGLGSG